MKANEILTVLEKFKDSSYQKILINGNWGVGKTKYISDFINVYSNACYVSLFGKRDVNSIIQEIYFHIIEKAPRGKIKKYVSVFREKMNNLDISYFGVSLSIPVIENMHNALNKELSSQDNTFIIVLDDLERKHSELDIKEVLGVVDSLSKIENIKIVLVAATDQFDEENKQTFKNYQEKAIDRTYTIVEYADEAPMKILGEQVWKVIGDLTEDYVFQNLRTFEKISLFIKEVTDVLGEDVFTEKFTRDDVYRMCFASVVFNIEHKGEMKLLDTNSDVMTSYYAGSESGVIDYLCTYILRNSLDNDLSKNIFNSIKTWHEIGTYSKEKIIDLITSINNFQEKPHNFFSSEEEILDIIGNTKKFILNLNGSEKIEDIIINLSTAFTWCEIFSVDFGISNEQVFPLIRNNIAMRIDITKSMEQNQLDEWGVHLENEKARSLVELVNETLEYEYINQLFNQIYELFERKSYFDISYLKRLRESVPSISGDIRSDILSKINDNGFFFPIPSGQISEQQWRWCHQINKLINEIERYWQITNYYNEFKAYFYNVEITKKDRMLQHRLKLLFEKK